MSKIRLVLFVSLALALNACTSVTEPLPEEEVQLRISTSIYPIYYFTSEIAQDKAEVTQVIPLGVEAHDYELTPQDLENLYDSDRVIVNGNLEPWIQDLELELQASEIPLSILTENMALMEGVEEDAHEEKGGESHEGEAKDPHVWLDPLMAYEMVERITQDLSQTSPENAAFFEANAEVLKNKLLSLDEAFTLGLQTCEKNTFVTAHAAFAYFAKRYSLEQIPIAGLSPQSEPSLQETSEITDLAREKNITVIFFETLVNSKLSEIIAQELGAETLVLAPLENLPQADFAAGKNYFTEMEQNLANLKIALECQ